MDSWKTHEFDGYAVPEETVHLGSGGRVVKPPAYLLHGLPSMFHTHSLETNKLAVYAMLFAHQ